MKRLNDLKTTISLMELPHDTNHFVIGSNDEQILDGTYDTVEEVHAKILELSATGLHTILDIESRDIDGETIEVFTVYQNDDDNEEEEENAIAAEKCYYADPNFCSGALWTCETCKEDYCEGHNHSTSKGENVECVACEHTRLQEEKENE